jgi:hypothetical protein
MGWGRLAAIPPESSLSVEELTAEDIPALYEAILRLQKQSYAKPVKEDNIIALPKKGTAQIAVKICSKRLHLSFGSLGQPRLTPIAVLGLRTSQSVENRQCTKKRSFRVFSFRYGR